MNPSLRSSLAVLGLVLPALAGCAAGGTTSTTTTGTDTATGGGGAGGSGGVCIPGQQLACACTGGGSGIQVCNASGTGLGPCDCGSGGSAGSGGSVITIGCGNAYCEGPDENCYTCPKDCGVCDPCTAAPSCANAQIPPATMSHVTELDTKLMPVSKADLSDRLANRVANGDRGVRLLVAALREPRANELPQVRALRTALAKNGRIRDAVERQLRSAGSDALGVVDLSDWTDPTHAKLGDEFPGGTPECGAPLLRIRAAQVIVHEEDDDWANDIVYCALTSEAMTASEIRVTPETPNLDEGQSYTFAIEAGVFWGQQKPETPGGNILLTYDCFEDDSSSGYQQLITDIGSAATQIGGVAGSYGWVFGIVGAVAPVVSGAMGLDGDDHLFNAQQVIPLDKQLDLTNGRFWSVRRSGTHINSAWDWELRIEAWGCAQYGTL